MHRSIVTLSSLASPEAATHALQTPAARASALTEEEALTEILAAAGDRDSIEFGELVDLLGGETTYRTIVNAFRSALAEGWLVAVLERRANRAVRYRLTAGGQARTASADAAGSASVADVLIVLADFDRFGGGTLGLIAWELGRRAEDLGAAWDEVVRDGLARESGVDVDGETSWRLTEQGHQRRADLGRSRLHLRLL
jgi:hypothetical protein